MTKKIIRGRTCYFEDPRHLSGINLEDLANALTDPNKRFEFPVKPFTYSMATSDKIILGGSLGAIAVGLFINAYINSTR